VGLLVKPAKVAPYFVLVTLVHVGAVITRFDQVDKHLPEAVKLAIMVAQFPLIMLSGYFEGRLDYGPPMEGFPTWMQIRSRPVKLAFTFAFIYLSCVSLQTLDVEIGPIDPSPPDEWPQAQRAAWFAMFTAGMFFPFYLATTGILIPILRVLTKPLRAIPALLGALLALVVGGGLGLLVMALVTWTKLSTVIKTVKDTIENDPVLAIGVTAAMTFGPMLLGLVLGKKDDD